jgi:hypothetical protein
VLERKAPPTFDVVIEIQDRDRVLVHADVADTVDSLLRGDQVAGEQRWRDEEGVHRSQARPRPSPREQLGSERFAGLVGAGSSWRMEPGWRGEGPYRGSSAGGFGYGGGGFGERGGLRPGYRAGASGSWRPGRGSDGGRARGDEASGAGGTPFVSGDIADRGPVERGSVAAPDPRARDARELRRQRDWRQSATRAIDALHADEGTGPVNATTVAEAAGAAVEDDEAVADRARLEVAADGEPPIVADAAELPTLRVLPHGISRKRLEQAIRELQLPVIVARDVDEADVVMTLRSEYRQKPPAIRAAEERALPIYVLKANTIIQMQSSLTSVFALEIDPREAAMRETEQAIGIVMERSEPVELAPQNAYIRRLQHQMAERANLVSRSRGREPYRRVRLYPDAARTTWR